MLNSTIRIKIQQRLNKLASQDYDNIPCWQIVESFNKAQIEWCRRQVIGRNLEKAGAEQTLRKIDDLGQILTYKSMTFVPSKEFVFTEKIPVDYLDFNRVELTAKSECCPTGKKITVYLGEETNADIYLKDDMRNPNFEWGETFCTVVDNKLKIYTADKFTVTDVKLFYYRQPVKIQINGCGNPYAGGVSTTDVECEFRDDIVEILIDAAAAILAGDIESFNQYTRNSQNSEVNT